MRRFSSEAMSSPSQQQPLPLAFVHGEAIIEKPEDLYIPPDALEVVLESFEGPLDLLLYLIKKQKFDISVLPILSVTQQYMEYVDVIMAASSQHEFTGKLELAGEYLLMAAVLAEIKSRVLLPKPPSIADDEDDPRANLVRRLQEYEAVKQGAQQLEQLPRLERDFMVARADTSASVAPVKIIPKVMLQELTLALSEALKRSDCFTQHVVKGEVLSTRSKMVYIMERLQQDKYLSMAMLLDPAEGKMGVVASFLAILELSKEGVIEFLQAKPFTQIYLRKLAGNDTQTEIEQRYERTHEN